MTGSTDERPRRAPYLAIGLLTALLASAGGMLWYLQTQPADTESSALGGVSVGGPFTLVNGAGETVTDQTFRGKYMLVYFGYTFCPDVCPTTLNDEAAALEKLGTRAQQVQPVFITVDPKRDTPSAVDQFAHAFSPRMVGLTGSADQIRKVAREYRVYYAEHRTGPGPNDYSMDHSSIIYLIGPDGKFISFVRADRGPDAMAEELAKHLGPNA